MPASKFTKKATTPRLKRMWQHIYDSELERGQSHKNAVIRANGRIKDEVAKSKKKK